MSLYDHIDYFTEIIISKKTVHLKKMTVRMQMNFIVNYRAWKLTGDKKALKEIVFDNAINPNKIKNSLYAGIALQVKNDIDKKNKTESEEEKKRDSAVKDWLADLIAFFGYYCGWNKEQVLDLYMDEIKVLIENVSNQVVISGNNQQDRAFEAHYFAVNRPQDYRNEVVSKRGRVQADKKDLDKLRKVNSAFLAKSFGRKDAVS